MHVRNDHVRRVPESSQIRTMMGLSMVVTTGPHAYRRPDGIAVVPAALLGP
jgi:uncharacterized protein